MYKSTFIDQERTLLIVDSLNILPIKFPVTGLPAVQVNVYFNKHMHIYPRVLHTLMQHYNIAWV